MCYTELPSFATRKSACGVYLRCQHGQPGGANFLAGIYAAAGSRRPAACTTCANGKTTNPKPLEPATPRARAGRCLAQLDTLASTVLEPNLQPPLPHGPYGLVHSSSLRCARLTDCREPTNRGPPMDRDGAQRNQVPLVPAGQQVGRARGAGRDPAGHRCTALFAYGHRGPRHPCHVGGKPCTRVHTSCMLNGTQHARAQVGGCSFQVAKRGQLGPCHYQVRCKIRSRSPHPLCATSRLIQTTNGMSKFFTASVSPAALRSEPEHMLGERRKVGIDVTLPHGCRHVDRPGLLMTIAIWYCGPNNDI